MKQLSPEAVATAAINHRNETGAWPDAAMLSAQLHCANKTVRLALHRAEWARLIPNKVQRSGENRIARAAGLVVVGRGLMTEAEWAERMAGRRFEDVRLRG